MGHVGIEWGGMGWGRGGSHGWGVSCKCGVGHVGLGVGHTGVCRGGVGHVEVGWVGHAGVGWGGLCRGGVGHIGMG